MHAYIDKVIKLFLEVWHDFAKVRSQTIFGEVIKIISVLDYAKVIFAEVSSLIENILKNVYAWWYGSKSLPKNSQKNICIVLYCNGLLTKHVTHNINIMHNILKGHNKLDYY